MLLDELIIDSFAGGGGASTGIEIALGRSPDVAINHDGVALAMHAINHPDTLHLPHNVWKVDPNVVTGGRPVGMLWASPDCKHFSKAKGGKPVEKSIRDLAWVVVRWARQVRPRVIFLENVEEFATWGPLGEDDRPCPERRGQEFKRWTGELKRLGYKVDWRELRACDYGAPTIRKRLFLIARRDGEKIVWPAPTHGDPKSDAVKAGKLLPWRTAAEIIDWSLPCHSIFLTKEEARAVGVKRPLADATMARIAKGVKRYVIDAAEPFIVNLTHHGSDRNEAITEPAMTVTGAHRGEKAVVVPTLAGPFIAGVGGRMGQSDARSVDKPAQTMTAKADSVVVTPFLARTAHGEKGKNGKKRGRGDHSLEEPMSTVLASPDHAVIAPTLIQTGYGERPGQEPRVPHIDKPLGTVVAGGVKHAVIAPHLMTHRNAEKPFNEANKPTHVITAGGAHLNVVAAHLTKFRKNSVGSGIDEPVHTVTANSVIDRPGGAPPMGVVAAFLAQHNTGMVGHAPTEPVSTIVQKGCTQGVVAAHLSHQYGSGAGEGDPEKPIKTVTSGGQHAALVAAFLQKYYGTDQDPRLTDPMHTATTKDRFGLVEVTIAGEPYIIADIGMRMLSPRELFGAQGFPPTYIIDRGLDVHGDGEEPFAAGPPVRREFPITKTDQVRMCGNSVCPPMAAALVKANFKPRKVERDQPDAPTPLFEAAE